MELHQLSRHIFVQTLCPNNRNFESKLPYLFTIEVALHTSTNEITCTEHMHRTKYGSQLEGTLQLDTRSQ